MSFGNNKADFLTIQHRVKRPNGCLLMCGVSGFLLSALFLLFPLDHSSSLAIFDYTVTKNDTEKEIHLRMEGLVDHIAGTVSFFLEEKKAALSYIVYANSFSDLNNKERLAYILEGLQRSTGGFIDLGLIDSSGKQLQYVGPYDLEGKNYRNKDWCKKSSGK